MGWFEKLHALDEALSDTLVVVRRHHRGLLDDVTFSEVKKSLGKLVGTAGSLADNTENGCEAQETGILGRIVDKFERVRDQLGDAFKGLDFAGDTDDDTDSDDNEDGRPSDTSNGTLKKAGNALRFRGTVDKRDRFVMGVFDSMGSKQHMKRVMYVEDSLASVENALDVVKGKALPPSSSLLLESIVPSNVRSNQNDSSVLFVRVIAAKGLTESRKIYCQLKLENAKTKRFTQQVDADVGSPYWNEIFCFPEIKRASSKSPGSGPYMRVVLKHVETRSFRLSRKVHIAKAIINAGEIAESGADDIYGWYPLQSIKSKSGIDDSSCAIQLSAYWAPCPPELENTSRRKTEAPLVSPIRRRTKSPVKLKFSESEVSSAVTTGRLVADASALSGAISKLVVTVLRAQDLVARDLNGKSDPYCIVECVGEKKKTPVIKRNLNPEWNHAMEFGGKMSARHLDEDEEIVVRIYDHDTFSSDDPMGDVHIPIWMIAEEKEDVWFPVEPVAHMRSRFRKKALGRLLLRFHYTRGNASFEDISDQMSTLTREPTTSLFGLGQYVKDRPLLRIHVIQARHIPPMDNSGFSDPYCVVSCRGKKYRTRACKQTLRPFWGQSFVFGNDEWISDSDTITITLYDKDVGSRDDLVGFIKLPLWALRKRWDDQRWYNIRSVVGKSAGEILLHVEYGKDDVKGRVGRRASDVQREISRTKVAKWYKGKKWKYRLELLVISGRDLVVSDRKTLSSDPYCYVTCGDSKRLKTKTKRQTLAPVWGELFKFKKSKGGAIGLTGHDQVEILLYDYDEIGSDDFMGGLVIDLSYVIDKMGYIDKSGAEHMEWFALGSGVGSKSKRVASKGATHGAFPYGALHLKFRLVPIAERRSTVSDKFALRIENFRMARSSELPTELSLRKSVYAKVEMWNGWTEVLPPRRFYDTLGAASINCEVRMDEDVDKLWKVVDGIIAEKEKSKMYARPARLCGINGTDTVVRVSVHDDGNGLVLGETEFSAETLRNLKDTMGLYRFAKPHIYPMKGSAEDARIKAEMRVCKIKEQMSPNIAFVNVRLEGMKMFVNNFKQSFRCVIKCAGRTISSRQYGGIFAIQFSDDQIADNHVIPVKNMFEQLEIEVWSKPYRRSKDEGGRDSIEGSFAFSSSFGADLESNEMITLRDAEKDAQTADNTLSATGAAKSTKRSLLGRLFGSAKLSIFDIVEIQANVSFADEDLVAAPMPSVKIPIQSNRGEIKGTVKAHIWLDENISTSGCLATFPNPATRREIPFSISNFRHEINRFLTCFGWVGGFFSHVGRIMNWEHVPTSAVAVTIVVLVLMIPPYSTRFLALFPACMLIHMINRHKQRFDGTFSDTFRQDLRNDVVASKLRVGAISGEGLMAMDSNGFSDPVVRIGIRKSPLHPTKYIGFSKPTYRTLSPNFSGTTAGCIPATKNNCALTRLTLPSVSTRVPAYETFVEKDLVTKPLLSVVLLRARMRGERTHDPKERLCVEFSLVPSSIKGSESFLKRSKSAVEKVKEVQTSAGAKRSGCGSFIFNQQFTFGSELTLSRDYLMAIRVKNKDEDVVAMSVFSCESIPYGLSESKGCRSVDPTLAEWIKLKRTREEGNVVVKSMNKIRSAMHHIQTVGSAAHLLDEMSEVDSEVDVLLKFDWVNPQMFHCHQMNAIDSPKSAELSETSWRNVGNEILFDVFDQDEANEREFMGRAIVRMSDLVTDEHERYQQLKILKCPLQLRFDCAKADLDLRHIAEESAHVSESCSRLPDLGVLIVCADMTLPDPAALKRAVEREEAKRADTHKNPIQKLRMVSRNLAWAQNVLYGINNTMERTKNAFNWAHPRKTAAVFALFVFLFVLFILVPSRFILLFLFLFFFTERFRPLGTMAIKAKHFIALLPTDDDLRDVASGIVSRIKRLKVENASDAIVKEYKRGRKLRRRKKLGEESDSGGSGKGLLPDAPRKRRLSMIPSAAVRKASNAISAMSRSDSSSSITEALKGVVVIGDAQLLGHVRVYRPPSISSKLTFHSLWKRQYCALYNEVLYFWAHQENAERGKAPVSKISNVVGVFPLSDAKSLDPHCEMQNSILSVDFEEVGKKTGMIHKRTTFLAFNSQNKAMCWCDSMNAHCLGKYRKKSDFHIMSS